MSKTFILKIAYGGLGDHLFMSPLPRVAKESGKYAKVLVSNCSAYRSADYRRLVWETNPYIDGFTDEDVPSFQAGPIPRGGNLLDSILLSYGLDDGKLGHEPELYFCPEIDEALRKATVYDPNYVSFVGKIGARSVEEFFAASHIVPDWMLKPRAKCYPVPQFGATLETLSLEHYCSVIRSAGQFICLSSGGATLAAALGVSAVVLWGKGQDTAFHHSRLHKYVNVRPSFLQVHFPAGSRYVERGSGILKRALKRALVTR